MSPVMSPAVQPLLCGVDVGACATKLVLLDGDGAVLQRVLRPSGVDYAATARACLAAALTGAGLPAATAVSYTVATGYGRHNVDFADLASTEIHCHGIGAYHHLGQAMNVVDIGGQDNKVIRLAEDGRRIDFKMNRKCAAGTGAFLEEIAMRLGIELTAMDGLAAAVSEAVRLSSFCTVFASTEILAHLRQGTPLPQIVRGTFQSVVDRVLEMGTLDGTVVLSGGVVAHNPTIATLLGDRLGREVTVIPFAQHTGALGAALTALRFYSEAAAQPESEQPPTSKSKEDQDA